MRGVLMGMVFLVVGGCDRASWMVDGGACPNPPVADAAGGPDMATPAPKCAAARGLAGDNLLCVDFKDVQQLTSLTGWNFFCTNSNWTSSGGFLQVNNFGLFQGECTAQLPAINLNDVDKLKYRSIALSLVHRIDLVDTDQIAGLYLNSTVDQTRLIYYATGKKNPTRQHTSIEVDKSDLPASINSTPQWLLKISATTTSSRPGWQIESIAINGIP